MTLTTILKTAIIAALATVGTGLPSSPLNAPADYSKRDLGLTEANLSEYLTTNNITIETGTVSSDPNLSKRADIPRECIFETSGISYNYYKMTATFGTACFGFVLTPNCGTNQYWQDPHWTDVQNVVRQQISKDGIFQFSRVGDWSAGFILPTSAYSNRDTTFFSIGLLANKIKATIFYYSRDGDYMKISKTQNFCN